jgi:chemotaxis-related protein WspD
LAVTPVDMRVTGGEAAPVSLQDCWKVIGVNGNQTCLELQRHIHCHNCPVYSAAAAQFLDRALPPGYRQEWAGHLALEKQIAAPAKTSVTIFRIGGEWLALPTEAFQEIAERRTMHTLPHRRRGVVLGVVNIRGELVICASLSKLLGLGTTLLPRQNTVRFNRWLVALWNGQRCAFPVEEVHGVHRFHTADLREPPATVGTSDTCCAVGLFPWREVSVGLLAPDALFAALNRNLS